MSCTSFNNNSSFFVKIQPTASSMTNKCSGGSLILPNSYAMFELALKDGSGKKHADAKANAQCRVGRSLYISPSLCADTATELDKCIDSAVLDPTKYDMMFDRVEDEEERMSMLTNFMTWASLTRDIEMQRGEFSCINLI